VPHLGIGRSKIGCIACSLLLLICVVDRCLGGFDLLDWPSATAGFLLIAGLPHGALDIELLTNAADDGTHFSVTALVAIYVSLALSVALLWCVLPTAALIGLLLLSAYHFGGDWPGLKHVDERLVIGAALLCAPTFAHQTSVAVVFSWLIPSEAASAVARAMSWASLPLLLSAAGVICWRWRKCRAQCEEIIVVAFAATVLQPLTFFAIYFCTLHSMRHLADVRQTLSKLRASTLVLRAAPYAAAAMASCWAGSVFFPNLPVGASLLSSVFVGLAALTVPHMLLCERSASLPRQSHEVPNSSPR
jgi:beta-carotene 15,15'-dioxygenase